MELVIGMIIVVALIVGFMVANDISERQSYEDVRKELGEKLLKKEKRKRRKKEGDMFVPLPHQTLKKLKNNEKNLFFILCCELGVDGIHFCQQLVAVFI